MGNALSCPECGDTEQLETIETITGLAGVSLVRDADGTVDYAWSGSTEVIWDTSTSVGIQCGCGWEYLGRDYVAQLVPVDPAAEDA